MNEAGAEKVSPFACDMNAIEASRRGRPGRVWRGRWQPLGTHTRQTPARKSESGDCGSGGNYFGLTLFEEVSEKPSDIIRHAAVAVRIQHGVERPHQVRGRRFGLLLLSVQIL